MLSSGERLVTMAEIAERTGRPVRVLRLWARQGRIPAVKVGRDWLVNDRDLPLIEQMPRRQRRRGNR